jgi:hypothetical protein
MRRLLIYLQFENVGFVNAFDGASAQDQKQDQMEDQETAPDQQGDMNHPSDAAPQTINVVRFHLKPASKRKLFIPSLLPVVQAVKKIMAP